MPWPWSPTVSAADIDARLARPRAAAGPDRLVEVVLFAEEPLVDDVLLLALALGDAGLVPAARARRGAEALVTDGRALSGSSPRALSKAIQSAMGKKVANKVRRNRREALRYWLR